MTILIVEDEITAARKLERLLKKLEPSIEIAAVLESAKEAVTWIRNNPSPDLGFFDIQLSDNTSFVIFEYIQVQFPVVFLTAYDDFLLKAFEHNTIYYLLKPVSEEKLQKVLAKYKVFKEIFFATGMSLILKNMKDGRGNPKRLLVRKGMDSCPLEINKIAYLFIEHKITFVKTKENELFLADQSLGELEEQLGSETFFRVNRRYLVSLEAIARFRTVDRNKIRLELLPSSKEEVLIGKERATEFRIWIKSR